MDDQGKSKWLRDTMDNLGESIKVDSLQKYVVFFPSSDEAEETPAIDLGKLEDPGLMNRDHRTLLELGIDTAESAGYQGEGSKELMTVGVQFIADCWCTFSTLPTINLTSSRGRQVATLTHSTCNTNCLPEGAKKGRGGIAYIIHTKIQTLLTQSLEVPEASELYRDNSPC